MTKVFDRLLGKAAPIQGAEPWSPSAESAPPYGISLYKLTAITVVQLIRDAFAGTLDIHFSTVDKSKALETLLHWNIVFVRVDLKVI